MIARTKAFRIGCPLCTIIPSHMMSRLAASADAELAAAAARTLRITTTMQAFRAQLTTGALPAAAAKRPGLRRQVFDCKTFDDLPGDPSRSEGDNAVQDQAVNQAYD
jgi:Arc/MetJ family transcription regulator